MRTVVKSGTTVVSNITFAQDGSRREEKKAQEIRLTENFLIQEQQRKKAANMFAMAAFFNFYTDVLCGNCFRPSVGSHLIG